MDAERTLRTRLFRTRADCFLLPRVGFTLSSVPKGTTIFHGL